MRRGLARDTSAEAEEVISNFIPLSHTINPGIENLPRHQVFLWQAHTNQTSNKVTIILFTVVNQINTETYDFINRSMASKFPFLSLKAKQNPKKYPDEKASNSNFQGLKTLNPLIYIYIYIHTYSARSPIKKTPNSTAKIHKHEKPYTNLIQNHKIPQKTRKKEIKQ